MNTPIVNFVKEYTSQQVARLHMPGHKGASFLGCEANDITEICGADSLYEAQSIIAQSEANATALFGTGHTFYSTEGSSQCIKAMLFLALQNAKPNTHRPFVLAGRNAHKTFLYASALLDFDVQWLLASEENFSLCSCPITPAYLKETLCSLPVLPFAVYVTSPDYLGNTLDIAGLAKVCQAYHLPLLVDNAHGAYHHFLPVASHPIDLGATACCDSGHKTLPVLTGGAYLQIAKSAPHYFLQNARQAMALFGSTSPSYLILQSLDLCNAYLANGYAAKLSACILKIQALKKELSGKGWVILNSEPLKLTIDANASGHLGTKLAQTLRKFGVECEYADPDYLVLMFTPENPQTDYQKISQAFGKNINSTPRKQYFSYNLSFKQGCSIRNAIFAKYETIPASQALGRICATPTVSCPPAIPIVVSGEYITQQAIDLFAYYEIDFISVIKE